MKTSQIEKYAPQARRNFIAAITHRAAFYGLTKKHTEPVTVQGDFALIGGQRHPAEVATERRLLEARIEREGFDHVMEAIAYTWFNRFVAIRYMEIHGYFDHGYRVLSGRGDRGEGTGTRPEIIDHAVDVDLPGLDREKVVELKLDGTQDETLYRLLLLAQCNALHEAMPFLFEKIGDETELLLPANLLHTDSLIRQLVEQVDEDLWQAIEIIGWLYQFYISEKKDQVIGKVVKSEDIPAATQLFTPNWIVKYMVQNSLGAQWLATYPDSPLKGQMEYYIEPAEQTDEVNAQLAAITPSTLDPEKLTLIDPACGSGHILVEAYDLFKAIYLERGYQKRGVAQLILEKNLFGLDIDERAAQLTGFALMMKARADDRRLFERGVKLNVMALVDSAGFDAEALAKGVALSDYGLTPWDLKELKRLFEHATTFGSLIQVPEALAEKLPALKQLSEATSQDLFVSEALKRLGLLVQQAELLAAQYDAVVANPPYIGSKGMNALVKEFVEESFPDAKSDLFACFIERDLALSKRRGRLGFMSPQVWMFLASYERLRARLIDQQTITSLVQPEYNAFWDSAHVTICSYIIQKTHLESYKGTFIRLTDFYGAELQPMKTLEAIINPDCGWLYRVRPDNFKRIPGSPVAYWIGNTRPFDGPRIGDRFESGGRTKTHGNETYLRYWWEVKAQSNTWAPYANGGGYRKYAGNALQVVNWSIEATSFYESHGGLYPKKYWGVEGITWGLITSARSSFRIKLKRSHYSSGAPTVFDASLRCNQVVLGFLNSPIAYCYLNAMNPTLNTTVNDVLGLPLPQREEFRDADANVGICIALSTEDWDAYEHSWDFQSLPLLSGDLLVNSGQGKEEWGQENLSTSHCSLSTCYTQWVKHNRETIAEMKRLEEENNRLFIDAYGLADELTPDVPIEQITLTVNPAYRYGGKLTEEELWTRFRQDTMEELVSYAIGCMMGRYSLDAPGLIYAHSGNEGFGPSRYTTFPADDDGILPITDYDWFDDDIANRVVAFMAVAWPAAQLEENLAFLADGLDRKNNESARDCIRRYLSRSFYKSHMQTYKKRPIYWMFSSGKQRAFQCLVYLHRYNEGTLARMRTEYVIPLQGKMDARINHLEADIAASTATSHRRKLEIERDTLRKQLAELRHFDEDLRHHADQRITLDLDDGVKVNYSKFGNLLAEVKAVTGTKSKED